MLKRFLTILAAVMATAGFTQVAYATNNPPVLNPIGSKTVNELATLAFTATATDPDAGQTITYSMDAGAPAGATMGAATGAFSWTPTEAQGPGSFPATIRATDNGSPALSGTAAITITVNEVNFAPVVTNPGNKTTNEQVALSFTVTGTDADLPANTITWSLDAGAPAGATIGSANGAFSWTPTEAQGPGTFPITIRATDNGGPALSAQAAITVSVTEVNVAPVVTSPGNQTVNELATLAFTVTATDADLPANTIAWSLDAGAPTGATIDAGTGAFSFTPTEAQGPGVYPITIGVSDGTLISSTSITVTVTACAPALSNYAPAFGGYNSTVLIDGTHLDGATGVLFNGVNAPFTVNSSSSITATVPNGATAGPIALVGPCGTGTSVDFFYPPGWPACGVPVNRSPGDQISPASLPDGSGGAIVAWQDRRGGDYDIYAQRMNANGQPVWPVRGVALCSVASSDQTNPEIVADGAGGAIVVWTDVRSSLPQPYVQHVLSTGLVDPSWPVNGVQLSTNISLGQTEPAITSDAAGGAIVAWTETASSTIIDIYAQHVLSGGTIDPSWTAAGVAVCTATGVQLRPKIASDAAGGAIVSWSDRRTGTFQIFARRLTAGGVPQWPGSGIQLSAIGGDGSAIVSDGAGGAVVTWSPPFAQRINANGVSQWTIGGVALGTGAVGNPTGLIPSADGGAIVVWSDHRGADFDTYVQRVSGGGSVQWNSSGVALCTAPGDQTGSGIVSDGAGGAIVTWQDQRSSTIDIYAHHVMSNGVADGTWTPNGVALCSDSGDQSNPTMIGGMSGAIVGWVDTRDGTGNSDIYAVRVSGNESIPTGVEPTAHIDDIQPRAWPNPFHGQVSIAFSLQSAAPVQMEVFDVAGRRVWSSRVAQLGLGRHFLDWNGRTDSGSLVASGIYFIRVQGPGVAVSRRVVCVK